MKIQDPIILQGLLGQVTGKYDNSLLYELNPEVKGQR
jgi:hypothetical protein